MGAIVIMLYERHTRCKNSISAQGPICQQNSVSESIIMLSISIFSTYWSSFFLNKYNFILVLASTVFKEYFVNTTEDICCWFSSINMIMNTCNHTQINTIKPHQWDGTFKKSLIKIKQTRKFKIYEKNK